MIFVTIISYCYFFPHLVTGILSFLGWLSIFVSRIVVFGLAASYIGGFLIILCLIHAVAVSIWVYSIAIESYHLHSSTNQTHTWTFRKRASIAILVFLFFGVPSLLIWPIMFQLKENRRPLVFLFIITIENICLLLIWFAFQVSLTRDVAELTTSLTTTHSILVTVVVLCTLSGVFFLTCYSLCKPKLAGKGNNFSLTQNVNHLINKLEAKSLVTNRLHVKQFYASIKNALSRYLNWHSANYWYPQKTITASLPLLLE